MTYLTTPVSMDISVEENSVEPHFSRLFAVSIPAIEYVEGI